MIPSSFSKLIKLATTIKSTLDWYFQPLRQVVNFNKLEILFTQTQTQTLDQQSNKFLE